MIMRVINWFRNVRNDDPVYNCDVYRLLGCSHVDGFLCNMESCSILEMYKFRELEQQLDIPLKDRMPCEKE